MSHNLKSLTKNKAARVREWSMLEVNNFEALICQDFQRGQGAPLTDLPGS